MRPLELLLDSLLVLVLATLTFVLTTYGQDSPRDEILPAVWSAPALPAAGYTSPNVTPVSFH